MEKPTVITSSPSEEGSPNGVLDAAFEAQLSALPEALSQHLRARMVDPTTAPVVRALLRGVRLAQTADLAAIAPLGEHLVTVGDASGPVMAIAALSFSTPMNPCGEPADMARLRSALETVFQGRRYALFVRRAVPTGFDPAPVARAVHMWLAAIDRGEWQGRHAIYEDDVVALEFTLVQDTGATGPSRLFEVGPVTALERLAVVDAALMALLQQVRDDLGELPLVVVLEGRPSWRLPRGYTEQLLYGTADWVATTRDGGQTTYRAGFRSNGRSLFSDGACAQLAALWWCEDFPADPRGFLCWSNENPWSDAPAEVLGVQAARFSRMAEGVDGRGLIEMGWSAPPPSVWVPRRGRS